ncbi:WD40-repeat-containing domain protein [Gorgonomyces haynaldii]|nr:WD40-repeat-containing domain protein [Gorgonomyces haynaldii]
MFADATFAIDIPCTWKTFKKQTHEISQQTIPIAVDTKETQDPRLETIDVQTDPIPKPESISNVDELLLGQFCKSVERLVSRQLIQNCQSVAFQNYTLQEEEKEQTKLLYKLKSPFETPVACLDVSSSGLTIVCGLGYLDHDGFCHHEGKLLAFHTFVRDFDPNTPSVLETSCCVSSIRAHPSTSVFAVGLFNGTIMLVNMIDLTVLHVSSGSLNAPTEPITQLVWDHDKIVSVSRDGNVCLWNQKLVLERMGSVQSNHVHRHLRLSNKQAPLGITCCALLPFHQLVIGTETGYLLRLSLDQLQPVDKDMIALNLVTLSYHG